MRLVIDANILIAALLKNATTRELLLNENIEFFGPEYLLNEIKRLRLNDDDLYDLTSAILSRIEFVPEKFFLPSIKQSLLCDNYNYR